MSFCIHNRDEKECEDCWEAFHQIPAIDITELQANVAKLESAIEEFSK